MEKKSQNDIYILTNSPIGDTIYCLAYLKEFKKQHPNKNIVLLGYKSRELIYQLYDYGYDRIEFIDSFSHKILSLLRRKPLINFLKHFDIYTTYPFFYKKVPFNTKETTLDVIRQDLLNLPIESQFTLPIVPPQTVKSIDGFHLIKEKIAVINPYSNTIRSVNIQLYTSIASYLQELGYIVYTNALSNQEIIPNTSRLNCSIYELYEICNHIPIMVSTRSGIIDFLISTSCNFYVLYFPVEIGGTRWLSNPINKFYNYFRLTAWNTGNVVEHIHKSESESLKHFKDYFTQVCIDQNSYK